MNYLEELFSVRNKSVIVTGASRGIGYEIASGFAKAGAIVTGIGRSEKESLSNLFDYQICDIRDKDSFLNLCHSTYNTLKKINVLVNAAGITLPLGSTGNSKIPFVKILETNLIAAFNCCSIVSSFMKKGDAIINITSIGAKLAFPDNPGYQASKGGLAALTRSLAYDLSKNNIRVNSIVPGYIRTQMTQEGFDNNELRSEREGRMLINRWGETKDLIGAAIFLASDASSYVTGTDICVDGGWSIKGI